MGDGWLWVTAHRTGEQGLVFQDLVESIDEAIDPNQVFNWFHDNITKEEAVDMLVKGIAIIISRFCVIYAKIASFSVIELYKGNSFN